MSPWKRFGLAVVTGYVAERALSTAAGRALVKKMLWLAATTAARSLFEELREPPTPTYRSESRFRPDSMAH